MSGSSPWLTIKPTPLAGLVRVERRRLEDARGFFSRLFGADELLAIGAAEPIAQVNQSFTRKRGSVRGLHFQHPPYAETKFVSCLRGQVFDVAVDLRRGSPTFLQWHGERLSEANHRSLYIPQGFAHGYQTLCDDCELLYLHSAPYASGAEGGVSPTDARLDIRWPLPFTEISERDAAHPPLTEAFTGIAAKSR